MTTTDLWAALAELAIAWRQSPNLVRFARDLPRNAPLNSSGLSKILQGIHAGTSALISDPLLLASRLPLATSVIPGVDMQQIRANYRDWINAANKVESAHRLTVAWLRSRLPGYPNLPVPQLTRGAPLTTDEFTYRVIWQPGERAQQLQMQDVPPVIADILQADAAAKRAILQATRDVVAAFARTPEWTAFEAAHATLDREARTDLQGARSHVRDRLSSAAVDEYAPLLALPRDAYRTHVIREALDGLNGTARAYADAFDVADGLIETAASRVFGQIACYPVRTVEVGDLEVIPGIPTRVRLTTSDFTPYALDPGSVVWFDDELVADAACITGMTLSFDQVSATVDLTAELLAGTAAAWPRSL